MARSTHLIWARTIPCEKRNHPHSPTSSPHPNEIQCEFILKSLICLPDYGSGHTITVNMCTSHLTFVYIPVGTPLSNRGAVSAWRLKGEINLMSGEERLQLQFYNLRFCTPVLQSEAHLPGPVPQHYKFSKHEVVQLVFPVF